ncbi:hypothetical protein D3875_04260 [Deinococcus cavernae]|uniref:PKD domain-containing protein n=1 Tax=Deinococcus cavernae TaxID=2320857 RepID=A0A418VEG7_9DEIO|nr:hypothetical protein [Deinococcus cavernae]RJF74500.1 hypothetical protein D3875_04260 [Deinococcus cavernae]
MNRTRIALLLLPLLLAACGAQPTPAPRTATAVPDTARLNFEAKVQADLQALGLAGNLSAQAVAPKAYLNVLKLSDDTVRAYFKTSYAAPTTCALDWGDGSVSSVVTPTPSTKSIDTADHPYSASGTYTIKLTCGTDVKTASFSAVVVKEITLNKSNNFTGAGIQFTSPSGIGTDYQCGLSSVGESDITISKTDGTLFNVKSIDAMQESDCTYSNSVHIIAYSASGSVIADLTSAQLKAQNLIVNWSGVKRVVCTFGNDFCDIRSLVVLQ